MGYEKQLEQFRVKLEMQHNARMIRIYPTLALEVVAIEHGYKFDKIFVRVKGKDAQSRIGRYMVETRTGDIYGIKSWTQINKRRWYGTLESIDQYDWSDIFARPLPGTDAEREQFMREQKIKATHKKRGRRSKVSLLSS